MKLDAKTAARLALPDDKDDVIHFDSTLPLFGLRLRRGAGGQVLRSWIAQYRTGGKTRRVLLGSAELIGLESARAAARKVLAKAALGEDPQKIKVERRAKDKLTVRVQVQAYLADRQPDLGKRTFVESRRYLTDPRYFGPLHDLPLDGVKRKHVADRVLAIKRELGSPTAARARGSLSAFYGWCMKVGVAESNPTIGAIAPVLKPRDRVLSMDELVQLWRACEDDQFGKIVKLLMMTGCRKTEIGDTTWDAVNFERGIFTISADRSKNGQAHELPLPPMALDILRSVPHMVGREQLFGERSRGRGFTNWYGSKLKLDARSGVPGFTLHDIRRSVATRMGEDLGIQPHVIECILNHSSGFRSGVAGTYNKASYAREMRAALALWQDHLRSFIEGVERKVIAIKA